MVRHRSDVHGFSDAAVDYWRTHRGECPFCLCFVREGTGRGGSFQHFTAAPHGTHWTACHHAYCAWLQNGGPLPLGSVQPSYVLARQSLLIGIVDLESVAALTARVQRWSRALKQRCPAGVDPATTPHSVMRVNYPIARGRSRAYWMIAFHIGPAGKSRRFTRWLHYPDQSLQQAVAARDQLCLDEILRLRRERISLLLFRRRRLGIPMSSNRVVYKTTTWTQPRTFSWP